MRHRISLREGPGKLVTAIVAALLLSAGVLAPAAEAADPRPDREQFIEALPPHLRATLPPDPGPGSLADMAARERRNTYRVDMNEPLGERDPMAPRDAKTWRDECLDKDLDFDEGWVKDRAHFCTHKKGAILTTADPDTGAPGQVRLNFLIYGWGSVGSGSQRIMTFNVEVLDIQESPEDPWPEGVGITAGVSCQATLPAGNKEGACNSTLPETRTIEGWRANPLTIEALVSQEKSPADQQPTGEGPENVVFATFSPYLNDITPSQAKAGWQAMSEIKMNAYARFDSAQYISGTHQGAVFRGVVPHISYDPKKARAKEVAEHIMQACDKEEGDKTFPASPDGKKDIPGCDIDHLIHRIFSGKTGWPAGNEDMHELRYNRNASVKDRNCNANTPSTSSPGEKQCDEFPFRSVYEGAAAASYPASEFGGGGKQNQFSIKRVNRQMNEAAGRDLLTFYNRDRILDWAHGGSSSTSSNGQYRDGFWVRIGDT